MTSSKTTERLPAYSGKNSDNVLFQLGKIMQKKKSKEIKEWECVRKMKEKAEEGKKSHRETPPVVKVTS